MIKNIKRNILIISLIIIVIFVVIYYQLANNNMPTTTNAYVTANVIKLTSEINGKVKTVAVHDFEKVKQGQALFELDDTPLKLNFMQAKNSLNNLEKRNNLLASMNMTEARINLMQAIEHLSEATIKAPSNGYIENIKIISGENLKAGQTAMTFIDNSHWWINAYFPENKLAQIKPGQAVNIRLAMYPKKVIKGVVVGIARQQTKQQFPVRIDFKSSKLNIAFRVGQRARVSIITK